MASKKYTVFCKRRVALCALIDAPVLLCAALDRPPFRLHQDSNFFYFTGLQEPGLACLIKPDGTATLFVPQYGQSRSQWVGCESALKPDDAEQYGFTAIEPMGDCCAGYSLSLASCDESWKKLLQALQAIIEKENLMYADVCHAMLGSLCRRLPVLSACVRDLNPIVAPLRRSKDEHEITALFQAAELTVIAQEAAAGIIAEDVLVTEVQAALEYVFTASGAYPAFPSIVASGKRATVLHCTPEPEPLVNGDCVIVDIGACVDRYCADVTRTYPVSGKFSDRQRWVYEAVLATQEHVASVAQPGFFLRNDDCPEKSLHHIAIKKLREYDLDGFFTHGIGHFIGLDVHDVGDSRTPLRDGDFITIEPGVYIPDEGLGIRIEDNYWIVKGGAICVTDALPKSVESIEHLVSQKLVEARNASETEKETETNG